MVTITTTDERVKISLIIAVYNAEKFLEKCLDSALKQDFNGCYEIILVNDGSTDSSLDICNHYAALSKKIKLINNSTNLGIAETRNIGLAHSTGQYIAFLDSDDYIRHDFLSLLHKIATNTNADVICFNHYWFNDTDEIFHKSSLNQNLVEISPEEFLSVVFSLKNSAELDMHFAGFLCNKFFRAEVLKGKVLRKISGAEDELFLVELYPNLKKIFYCGTPLYFYNRRQGSLCHNKRFALHHLISRELCQHLAPDQKTKLICATAFYQSILRAISAYVVHQEYGLKELLMIRKAHSRLKDYSQNLVLIKGMRLFVLKCLLFAFTSLPVRISLLTSKFVQTLYHLK